MSLEKLAARGPEIGERIVVRKQDELINRTDLPEGVSAEKRSNGIAFVGQGIRRRYITDGIFRSRLG